MITIINIQAFELNFDHRPLENLRGNQPVKQPEIVTAEDPVWRRGACGAPLLG